MLLSPTIFTCHQFAALAAAQTVMIFAVCEDCGIPRDDFDVTIDFRDAKIDRVKDLRIVANDRIGNSILALEAEDFMLSGEMPEISVHWRCHREDSDLAEVIARAIADALRMHDSEPEFDDARESEVV